MVKPMESRLKGEAVAKVRREAETAKRTDSVRVFELSAEEAVSRFSDLVYKIALARCRQEQDAEDVFQDVFLAFSKNQPVFASEEHAKAWFIKVTCNTAYSFWRKPRHTRELPFDDAVQQSEEGAAGDYDRAEEGVEKEIRRIDLEHCLERLQANDRELIHLFYYEDLRTKDIAQIWGKKEGALRMQLSRARKALKECLEGRV